MSYTFEEIVAKMTERRLAQSPLLTQMMAVRDRHNGDYVIPMPNTADETPAVPTMPAVIANAIENTSLRAGSMQPSIFCPALDGGLLEGPGSPEYAAIRKRALAFTWYKSYWTLASRRAFRHLAGYYTTALDVQWDFEKGYPCVKTRDPLSAYPEPKAPEDLSPPADIGYIYAKSVDWIKANYPEAIGLLGRSATYGGNSGDTQMWQLVEWIDEDHIVIGILGPQQSYRSGTSEPYRMMMELRRYPNKAGRCTSYIPRRVTLDRIANQVANMVGTTDLMAKLVALDVRATEQSIYPDRYIMGKLGQAPRLVGGKWFDGASGEVNIIMDAESVGLLRGSPDPHNSQTIDRLERAANQTMGVVPQQVGETYGALRTGRGMDTLMGASVDPRIQELHEIMQVAMTHCNEIILDSYKGYAGNRKITGFSGWQTDRGQTSFVPNRHFESNENAVLYAIPGADVQTATITLGQLYGTKAISLKTLRLLHPYVYDDEGEGQQRLIEEVEDSTHAAFFQRAAQGGVPPIDAALLLKKLRTGLSFEDALIELEREAQERQAQQAPPPGEGQAVPPEMMPGLGHPGEGGQMQPPANTVPAVEPGLDHLRQLVRNLQAPNRGVGVNAPVQ